MSEVKYKIRKIRKKRRTNLRVIIKQKRITQTQLAQLSDLEIYQVSNIVSGKQKDMLMSTAKKICNALNVSLDEAFGEFGDCEHPFKYLKFEEDGACYCDKCDKKLR